MATPNVSNVLSPEQIIEQLRTLMAQIGPVTPLTAEERRIVREQARTPQPVMEASINVIGASDMIAQAVGLPAAEVQQMLDEVTRWTAVEGEFRAALNGVTGSNLVRRQRIAVATGHAYQIGSKLARVPGQAALVPHVQEVKRLKGISRRKKRGSQTPAPAPSPAPAAAEEPPKVL
jgi:hypothetical protein